MYTQEQIAAFNKYRGTFQCFQFAFWLYRIQRLAVASKRVTNGIVLIEEQQSPT